MRTVWVPARTVWVPASIFFVCFNTTTFDMFQIDCKIEYAPKQNTRTTARITWSIVSMLVNNFGALTGAGLNHICASIVTLNFIQIIQKHMTQLRSIYYMHVVSPIIYHPKGLVWFSKAPNIDILKNQLFQHPKPDQILHKVELILFCTLQSPTSHTVSLLGKPNHV